MFVSYFVFPIYPVAFSFVVNNLHLISHDSSISILFKLDNLNCQISTNTKFFENLLDFFCLRNYNLQKHVQFVQLIVHFCRVEIFVGVVHSLHVRGKDFLSLSVGRVCRQLSKSHRGRYRSARENATAERRTYFISFDASSLHRAFPYASGNDAARRNASFRSSHRTDSHRLVSNDTSYVCSNVHPQMIGLSHVYNIT